MATKEERIGKQIVEVKGRRYVYRVADVRDENGKRIRKAFPSLKEAERWIATFRAEQSREAERRRVTRAKVGALADNLTPAQLADAAQAIERLPDGVTLVKAADFFTMHNPTAGGAVTVKQLVEDHIADRERIGRREQTIAELRHTLGHFAKFIGEATVPAVTTGDVERFLDAKRGNLDTRNKNRVLVAALFNRAIKRGLRATNPTAPIEATRMPRRAPRILKVDDVRALLLAAAEHRPDMVPYIALAAFCGIRPQEITRLNWSDLQMDREHPVVYIAPEVAKTHTARYVPLPACAIAWIAPHRKKVGLIRYFRKALLEVATAAKVTLSKDVFRHTYASFFIKLHGDAKTREAMGQQSVSVLFKHYVQAVPDVATAEAYFQIMPPERTVVRFPLEKAG